MGQIAQKWLNKLHAKNPYEGFDYHKFPIDLPDWGSYHPIFANIISQLKPTLILEVGTWKGSSAIHIATLLRDLGLDSVIICIDTWLGGLEHIISADQSNLDIRQYCDHGYPRLYDQFLANVMHCNCQDWIVPFPNTSNIAAKWFAREKVLADFIYIDASHDEDDVYADLVHYWDLLKPNGIMLGDDWVVNWYGVICAVNRFVKERDLTLGLVESKWAIQKPSEPINSCPPQVEERLQTIENFLQEFSTWCDPTTNLQQAEERG